MGVIEANRFSVYDFSKVLDLRNRSGIPYLLIGGQAVNYWAERFLSVEPGLHEFLPFTSVDIDFKGTKADVESIAAQLGVTPVFPPKVQMTALAGAIPFRIGLTKSVIEVVRQVPGVSNNDLESMAVEAELEGKDLRVMDPISLIASKLKLAFLVSQEKRQDVAHLKILVICVRGFLREILALIENEKITASGWIGAVNRMQKLATSNQGRKAARKLGVEWSKFLPVAEIMSAKNQKLIRFREIQFSRWEAGKRTPETRGD